MKQINDITFVSEENMTFVHVDDLTTDLGPVIQIGIIPGTDIQDTIENYTEVEKINNDESNEFASTFNLRKNIKSKTKIDNSNSNNVALSFEAEIENESNYINSTEL